MKKKYIIIIILFVLLVVLFFVGLFNKSKYQTMQFHKLSYSLPNGFQDSNIKNDKYKKYTFIDKKLNHYCTFIIEMREKTYDISTEEYFNTVLNNAGRERFTQLGKETINGIMWDYATDNNGNSVYLYFDNNQAFYYIDYSTISNKDKLCTKYLEEIKKSLTIN